MKRSALVVIVAALCILVTSQLSQSLTFHDQFGSSIYTTEVISSLPFDTTGMFLWQIEDSIVSWFANCPDASILWEGCFYNHRLPEIYLTERVQIAAISKDTAEFRDIPESRLATTVTEFAFGQNGLLLGKAPAKFRYSTACMIALGENAKAWEFVPADLRNNPAFIRRWETAKEERIDLISKLPWP
ncbi:MAG: hypothetical protein Q7R86_00025 [bacterium]|nr:hypothetical protein [bacterium]